MRIGILTPSIYMYRKKFADRIFAPGDLARHLVAGLAKRGHEVHWFTAPEEAPNGVSVHAGDRALLEDELQLRQFQDVNAQFSDQLSLFGTKMYYEEDLVVRAYAAYTKKQLDIIHVFHSFGRLAHYFQEFTGAPTLFTLHDPVPDDTMLESWLFRRFPGKNYISISNSQRGKYASHFVDTVYNGIDVDAFAYSDNPRSGFVSVGRLIAEKGHDFAIAAVKKIGSTLTIASWVSDPIKKTSYYMQKIAPEIDGKQIQLYSLLQGKNLSSVYQNAKALIFPIQWEEPFGLVMVEAMSCGTPVIAFDRGSVSEVVKDGVTGFVVPPEAGVEGLVAAMKKIDTIDPMRCRQHVVDVFSLDTMTKKYEDVYKNVLSK